VHELFDVRQVQTGGRLVKEVERAGRVIQFSAHGWTTGAVVPDAPLL
jgi:hypothetical protein